MVSFGEIHVCLHRVTTTRSLQGLSIGETEPESQGKCISFIVCGKILTRIIPKFDASLKVDSDNVVGVRLNSVGVVTKLN